MPAAAFGFGLAAERLEALARERLHQDCPEGQLPTSCPDDILESRMTTESQERAGDSIAIVAVTYNRLHLLRQCVENVLQRTSDAAREIVVWNNASTDGTTEYLNALGDPRITVVNHDENIGVNAYSLVFPRTSADYFIELDDDVVDAPEG